MSIPALVAALTGRIPDLVTVIPGPTDWSEWLDVSNEHHALTLEHVKHSGKWGIYYPDSEEERTFKREALGPDEMIDDMLQLVDRVAFLFEQAESDKLLKIAHVNGREVFLPTLASYSDIVRSTPFGQPEKHVYTVTYANADGTAGSLKRGESVRLGKRTIINVAQTGKA